MAIIIHGDALLIFPVLKRQSLMRFINYILRNDTKTFFNNLI